jgi:hypothetical protein
MSMMRLATVLGADTSVVPDVKPKIIEELLGPVKEILGNAMWFGIICGVLGLIVAGAMIAIHNRQGPGAGGEAVEKIGWTIAGVLIALSAPIIIRQIIF